MAAPTSKIRGTFKDSQGNARSGVEVIFEPLGTPFAAGGDVVTSPPISVTLTIDGTVGIAEDFVLVQGGYRVIISDIDAFTILVPGDGAYHDIDDVTADIGGTTPALNKPVTGVDLALSLTNSTSVLHSRKGDAGKEKTRFVFSGEGTLSSLDRPYYIMIGNEPDEIIIAGNLNTGGAAGTIDANIGQWFHSFIYPYSGAYGSGSPDTQNHFWYALGDQDWVPTNVTAVTDYLTLPNNERYYKKVIGNVALFVLDSNASEPDGNTYNSTQGVWLQTQLATSTERWKIVVFRDAPVASKTGYSFPAMEWPFASWGANMILAAGVGFYERIDLAGIPMIVCGGLKATPDTFGTPIADSQYRYNTKRGFLSLDASEYSLKTAFISEDGDIIDSQEYLNSDYGNVTSSVILQHGGGLFHTDYGLAVKFGSANGMVLGGTAAYLNNITGRIIRAAYLPTPAEVAAAKWLMNCLYLIGDDPPELYYFNKAYGDFVLFASPSYASSYHSGSKPKLNVPTLTPSSGTTAAISITHADSAVAIWVSTNGGAFVQYPDWDSVPFAVGTEGPLWVAVYASKSGSEDSDIVTAQYNA